MARDINIENGQRSTTGIKRRLALCLAAAVIAGTLAAGTATARAQSSTSYRFPWRAGDAWTLGESGWHDSWGSPWNFPQGSGLDFIPSGGASHDVLAAAAGAATLACDSLDALVVVRSDNSAEQLGYLHLDPTTVKRAGIPSGAWVHVAQGQLLGQLLNRSFGPGDSRCGTHSTTPHLHLYTPNGPPFTIDGVNFTGTNGCGGCDVQVNGQSAIGRNFTASDLVSAHSSPAVTSRSNGNADVFVTGTDGHLYHKWTVNGSWYGGGTGTWEVFRNFTFMSGTSPAVHANGLHPLDVWGQGTDGHLYHQSLSSSGWSGWDVDRAITLD